MTSIQMPQLGETIVEGTILKWLKNEGDTVERDEPLFEISTDKVDTEVPSPVAGTVTKLLVAEGATVPVGTDVMEIDDGTGATRERRRAPPRLPRRIAPVDGGRRRLRRCRGRVACAGRTARCRPPCRRQPCPTEGPRSQILSPIVRRLAREHGIDLATVAGTGDGGRITKTDVLAAAGGAAAPAAAAVAVVPSAAARRGARARRSGAAGRSARRAARTSSRCRTSARRSPRTCSPRSTRPPARGRWSRSTSSGSFACARRQRGFAQKYGVKLTYLPMVVARDGRRAPRVPARELADRRRRHRHAALGRHGHRGLLRRRADRAGDQRRRRDEHRRGRPRDRGPRGAGPRA